MGFGITSLNSDDKAVHTHTRMGPEAGGSVGAASASTGLFSGPDIAAQVQELEKRIAHQVGEEAHLAAVSLGLDTYDGRLRGSSQTNLHI